MKLGAKKVVRVKKNRQIALTMRRHDVGYVLVLTTFHLLFHPKKGHKPKIFSFFTNVHITVIGTPEESYKATLTMTFLYEMGMIANIFSV